MAGRGLQAKALKEPEGVVKKPRAGTASDLLVTYSAQVVSLLLGLLASIILARALGPEGRGVIQIVRLLAVEAAAIVSFGIAVSAVYVIARREFAEAQVVAAVLVFCSIAAVLILVLMYVTAPLWIRLLLSDVPASRGFVVASGLLAGGLLTQGSILGVYRGSGRFRAFAMWSIAASLLYTASLVVFLVMFEATVERGLYAIVVPNLLVAGSMSIICARSLGVVVSDFGVVLRRLLTFNLAGYGGTVLQEISYRLDLFFVALFLSTTEVGLYSVAVASAQLLWFLPNAAGMVVLARTASDEPEPADKRFIVLSQTLFTMMSVAAAILILSASVLVPFLYGREFSASVSSLRLLLPGVVALGLWKVAANHLAGRGQPRHKLHGAAIGAIVTVSLDLLLIPRWGMEGAAFATTAAYLASTVHIVLVSSRVISEPVRRLLLMDRETFVLVAASVRAIASSRRPARAR